MQRFPMKAMLAAGLLAALTAPVAVQAQKAQAEVLPSPPAMQQDADGGPAGRPRPHGPGPMGGMAPGLQVAAQLAATETYLGITDEQQQPWREYCQALIGFMQFDPPPAGDPGQLMAERMAQAALARADKAQALLTATTALRAALDPEQLDRLIESQPGPRGPQRPGGPQGPGDAGGPQRAGDAGGPQRPGDAG
jgi:hypothetical protein